MAKEPTLEYIAIPVLARIDYRWAAGRIWSKAKKALRDDKRLLATQCPECKAIFIPPGPVCGECYVYAGDNWVELSQTGKLLNFTGPKAIPLFDPAFGKDMVDEYAHGTIELDGGGILNSYRIGEVDPDDLRLGMRLQAVWKEEGRVGRLDDLLYFKPIEA